MKTITLNILAEDIRTTNYYNSFGCAITLSLRRANLNAKEIGGEIQETLSYESIKTPIDLDEKVRAMYKSVCAEIGQDLEAIEPQDFTYSLEIPDDW